MKFVRATLIFTFLITTFFASAQFKIGVGGGLNLANVSGDLSTEGGLLGFNVGLIAEVKLPSKLGIEADVLYSVKGSELSVSGVVSDLKLAYIDIPVLLKIYTAKVLSFQVGPQYSILASADFNEEDIKDDLKSGDFSVVAGIGVDVLKLHFAARYNIGLLNVNDNGLDIKNQVFQVSLGFWIK